MEIIIRSGGYKFVKRVHRTLKAILNKQKRGNPMGSVTPEEQLDKALYVLNFLNRSDHQLFTTAADRHFGMVPPFVARPRVWYKEFGESQWTGPVELIKWEEGMCVFSQQALDGYQQNMRNHTMS